MTNLSNILSNDKKREKIKEFLILMQDETTPEYMKKIYSAKCEIVLLRYSAYDYNALWNEYLMVDAGIKNIQNKDERRMK